MNGDENDWTPPKQPETEALPVFVCGNCDYRIGIAHGTYGGLPTLVCRDCGEELRYEGVSDE